VKIMKAGFAAGLRVIRPRYQVEELADFKLEAVAVAG
jgi:hypothetical protein